ncbi:mandelate racemase/muconate lactonizing enzyme family protein [Arthrobacter castelli]|uniref:mandelate racemase/muconate lactonizing enzyme family protein n=1 Tax=Arthrobacter castelli TaxID=271431 RepID=UPI000412A484|nr:mandelate racemase/muconate lactonizing enzyme family protein [Arthrobacter castelli]
MRITQLRATPVAVPFNEDEVWAFGRRRGMVSIVLEIVTDDGVIGLGEAAAYPSADIVLSVFGSIEPLVVGEDPFNIERIMKRINVIGTWHHVKATSPAIAAVEMACWDIVGKVSGQPLVNLFGGRVRDEVEFFYYLSHKSPKDMGADAAAGFKAGFRTFYVKTGSDNPNLDIERVEAIRAAAGPDALIRIDPNEAWSSSAAIRIITEMERFGLELVEQPVSGRNLAEMAYVRSRINTPLLANEASWTRYDQLEVIKAGAADVVSVDNQMDGGLLNLKRGAGLCEVAGLPVLKHSLGELGIAAYAGVHIMASTPNFLYANQGYGSFLSDDIIKDASPLPYRDGRLAVPTKPGIGVELDTERVAKYADLYKQEAKNFAFHESDKIASTPLMPKF